MENIKKINKQLEKLGFEETDEEIEFLGNVEIEFDELLDNFSRDLQSYEMKEGMSLKRKAKDLITEKLSIW